MLVLTFNVDGRDNCVTVDGAPYVYARTEQGPLVLAARCPHRGGPLHLATPGPDGTRLVCPWHERSTSLARLRRGAPPAVRRGNVVTAVFPGGDGTPHHLEHRPRSAALTSGRRLQEPR